MKNKYNFKEFEINTDLVKEILFILVIVFLLIFLTGCTPNKEVPLKLPYDVKIEDIIWELI